MNLTHEINIKVNEIKNQIFQITLGDNIQGGNDALNFSAKLMELCQNNAKTVIIDLSNVKMMNSTGIGMLVSGLTTLKKNNASLILVNIPEKIQSLLKMTHLDQVFITYPNIEEALKHC